MVTYDYAIRSEEGNSESLRITKHVKTNHIHLIYGQHGNRLATNIANYFIGFQKGHKVSL